MEDDKQTPPENQEEKQEKTFTQEELEKTLDARLKREREKAEKETADRLKKEREEWERQAKLSQEEREKEERERMKQETAEREREITLRENRADARELLLEKNISADLVSFVVDVDADKTKENIEQLEQAFTKAVEAGIADRMKGETPKDKSNNTPPATTTGTVAL